MGAAALAVAASPARAEGDLSDVIRDLYGGDGITLAPPPPDSPFPSHSPHFTSESLEGLDQLNSALVSNLGFLSFNAVSTGFTFDPETGIPQRVTDTLGPLLAERATTLGRGQLNVGFSYTHADFDEFEGDALDDLSLSFGHIDANGDGIIGIPTFELDEVLVNIDLELEQQIFALFLNYGLTDRWDAGIIIPVVQVKAEADAVATIIDNSPGVDPHFFDPSAGGDPAVSSSGGTETGIGDVVLRTKYTLLVDDERLPDLAGGVQVILPTGDEDDLLGTGETRVLALLIASDTYGWLAPHANVGYEWAPGESQLNSLRYIVGTEFDVHPRITPSIDVLGRYAPVGDRPGEHIIDGAVGARLSVWDEWILSGYVQFPLNPDEGLRADVIWTIGVEKTF